MLFLFAAVLIAYVPSLMGGGVVWDDGYYVTENQTLRSAKGALAPVVQYRRDPTVLPAGLQHVLG